MPRCRAVRGPRCSAGSSRYSLKVSSTARAFVRALRDVAKKPVVYAELARTQHAFDVFPSIRSAHVVRGVDRFLRWTYDQAIHAAETTPTVEPPPVVEPVEAY